MYKLLFLLLPILIILSCNSETSIKSSNLSSEEPEKENINKSYLDSIPEVEIGKGVFFSFKFDLDSSRYSLDGFKVYQKGKLIHNITYDGFSFYEYDLIDWNFDGYKDISILDHCGSGGCAYYIWNYIPQENGFKLNQELSGYLGLERDSVNQWIIFHYRAGYTEEMWSVKKYVADTLFPVRNRFRERWSDTSGNDWEKNTSGEFKNDEWLIKIDSFISN